MDEVLEDLEESILYELLPYSEWSQEQDVIVYSQQPLLLILIHLIPHIFFKFRLKFLNPLT